MFFFIFQNALDATILLFLLWCTSGSGDKVCVCVSSSLDAPPKYGMPYLSIHPQITLLVTVSHYNYVYVCVYIYIPCNIP
jgi:hypothetical protein